MTEAQEMLLKVKPAIREVFWISQCWNDHNFSYDDLIEKCKKISKQMLGNDLKHRDVDRANEWLRKVDDVCKES